MSESPGHRPSRAPKVAALALLGAGQCRVSFEQVAYARTLMKLNQAGEAIDLETHSDRR